jgi:hypothetical protein
MLWRRCRRFFLGLSEFESAPIFFLRRLDPVLEATEALLLVLVLELLVALDVERTGFNRLDGICVPNARFVPLILRRFLVFFFTLCLASFPLSSDMVKAISFLCLQRRHHLLQL